MDELEESLATDDRIKLVGDNYENFARVNHLERKEVKQPTREVNEVGV